MLLESAVCEESELVLLSYLESVKHSMAFGLHGTRQEIVVAVSQNFAASLVCDKESNTCMGRGGVKRTIAVEDEPEIVGKKMAANRLLHQARRRGAKSRRIGIEWPTLWKQDANSFELRCVQRKCA
ncbi:hypothetical protein B296_00040994 [Ensete ventricosum]|uniref:Uncharacterized protein n=1 Tax=Ensete ventricosum TaxID=4639 RepID=A0A426YUX3_ENSVE|nr:hypothetical protein B296_00040994 [Ensete ventricosum]